jgi:dimethylargininase
MTNPVALVRQPSSRMAEGITTHIDRVPADADGAARQHAAYVAAVAAAGWTIHEVAPADDLPDSAFVEDTMVVLADLAVLARPGAVERRAEVAGAEEAVRALGLEVARIEEPGTLDGIRQLRRHAATRGRTVVPVRLHGVLHLKSAVTALPDGTCLAHDVSLFDASPFPAIRRVPEEAGSHVILLGGGTLVMAASAPRSAELFDDMGFDVVTVDIAEFEKREGCVTCLSVLVAGADA